MEQQFQDKKLQAAEETRAGGSQGKVLFFAPWMCHWNNSVGIWHSAVLWPATCLQAACKHLMHTATLAHQTSWIFLNRALAAHTVPGAPYGRLRALGMRRVLFACPVRSCAYSEHSMPPRAIWLIMISCELPALISRLTSISCSLQAWASGS
jgi:hypothetical protein